MKYQKHKTLAKGSITVFLSLILMLIFSLLLTIIEGARITTARIYTERALSTAMDSVLADYYGPLWEEYHIFGYYPGEGTEKEQNDQISALISNYMSYTLEPDKDLGISDQAESYELFNTELNSVTVSGDTKLMDYQGELLMNEAVEYMKYYEIGNGIELLLNKLSLLKTPEKVSYIYEEKQKAEEELAEIDKGVLKLMELLDGIKTSKKGIEVTKDGKLKTTDYFVKMICFGGATMEKAGINQENIYLALKDSYIDPMVDFNTIQSKFPELEQAILQKEEIYTEIQEAEDQLLQEQEALEQLNSKRKKTKKDNQHINGILNEIEQINSSINELYESLERQEEIRQQIVDDIYSAQRNVQDLTISIKPIITEAITTIDSIIKKAETAAPLINQYEKILTDKKGLISEEVYSGLEENLAEMKRYVGDNKNSYNFSGMREILEKDLSILSRAEDNLNKGKDKLCSEYYDDAQSLFETAKNELMNYQISGLTLDYSTLVLDKSSQKNPLDKAESFLKDGITSLVMDPGTISTSELSQEMLPSDLAAMTDGSTDYLGKLASFFKDAVIGDGNSGMGSLFGSIGDETGLLSKAGDGVNKLAEFFLFQEYLKEHFEMYSGYGKTEAQPQTAVTSGNADQKKPSALNYEQEYLIAGKRSDKDNLSSITSRIVFLRMISDFVSLIGDSTKRNEAKLTAATLVGFTGLTFLISITQVLILLCWALAEALLDTCILMMGKEVPILKKKVVLELPDLFMISRAYLKEKANTNTNTKELSLSYQGYISIFLLAKDKKDLAYRAMDLMQENIKLRYDTNSFLISNCIFGYEGAADYTIESKFTGISFVRKFLNTNPKGYEFRAESAYSY